MRMLVDNLLKTTHPQWQPLLKEALKSMNPSYLNSLNEDKKWLPGSDKLLAAFTEPLDKVRYLLLGESPYPRAQSANGYAFWDNAVHSIWSDKGLSKEVNRATSLRNFIKMLLLVHGDLKENNLSQPAIAQLDKTLFCKTAEDLFQNLIKKGFLLLNASLVFSKDKVRFHAKHWQPFMISLFQQLSSCKAPIELILWGGIAKQVPLGDLPICLVAEHPYNLSFITNPDILNFFKPLDLIELP
jgi:uracil-DNA glycosylase